MHFLFPLSFFPKSDTICAHFLQTNLRHQVYIWEQLIMFLTRYSFASFLIFSSFFFPFSLVAFSCHCVGFGLMDVGSFTRPLEQEMWIMGGNMG
jgi:hypothetical protein